MKTPKTPIIKILSGICIVCEKEYTKPARRGTHSPCCDNAICTSAAKKIAQIRSDKKSQKISLDLNDVINKRFYTLSGGQRNKLLELLYEEIKRDYMTIHIAVRRAFTNKNINKKTGVIIDKKKMKNISACFYAFCVENRRVTPKTLFFKNGKIGKTESLLLEIKTAELNLTTTTSGQFESLKPYDSNEFCDTHTIGGVIAWLCGKTDKLELSGYEERDLSFDDDDDDDDDGNSYPAGVVVHFPTPTPDEPTQNAVAAACDNGFSACMAAVRAGKKPSSVWDD